MTSGSSLPAPGSKLLSHFRASKQRLPLHPLEKAVLAAVAIHLCFLPWALGTMHVWSQITSLVLATIGFLLALIPRTYSGDNLPPINPQVSGFRSQVSESRFQPSAFPVVAPSYDVINLGGGNNPLSITAMIGIMEAALGKKAKVDQRPASDADMKETWADISKAGRLLGWAPKTITEEGFKQAVDWHLENRDWLGAINL